MTENRTMSTPPQGPKPEHDPEAQRFLETLEQTGQLADVEHGQDTAKLPATITHVRYPDGTVRRIRFTGYGQR
jgi:allantoicase